MHECTPTEVCNLMSLCRHHMCSPFKHRMQPHSPPSTSQATLAPSRRVATRPFLAGRRSPAATHARLPVSMTTGRCGRFACRACADGCGQARTTGCAACGESVVRGWAAIGWQAGACSSRCARHSRLRHGGEHAHNAAPSGMGICLHHQNHHRRPLPLIF